MGKCSKENPLHSIRLLLVLIFIYSFFSRIFLFKTFLSVLMIYYYFIFSGEHYIYIGTVFGATQQRVKKQEKKYFFFQRSDNGFFGEKNV